MENEQLEFVENENDLEICTTRDKILGFIFSLYILFLCYCWSQIVYRISNSFTVDYNL